MKCVAVAAAGACFGFALSSMGFTDFGEVHKMFVLAEPRLLLTFVGGSTLTGMGLLLLGRDAKLQGKPLHPGIVPGGVCFGAGWAITGVCPSAAFAQLGEGKVLALLTLTGVALGMIAYKAAHRRFFRWDRGSCADE